MNLRIELCVDDISGVEIASQCGIDRVELCRDLWCGGLTPAKGLIQEAVLRAPDGGLQVLIREQADTFILSEGQVEDLCRVIEDIRHLTDAAPVPVGFVVGAIAASGEIDTIACARFRAAAGDRPLTFHRAFDCLNNLARGIDTLVALGYDRVLTTGGDVTEAQIPVLRGLQELAGEDLTVIGSGGLRSHNVAEVARESGLREVHMRAPAVSARGSRVAGTSRSEVERIMRSVTD